MKLPTPFQLVGICLAAGIIWAIGDSMRNSGTKTTRDIAPVTARARSVSPEEHDASQAACERDTRANIENLERLQIAHAKHLRALAKTAETRRFVQLTYQAAWTKLLASNQIAFEKLSRSASASPSGGVTCTICSGTLNLGACIVCTTAKGKCVTCLGTGIAAGDEECPACLGSGKCFVCLGTGSMPCVYCDDGVVRATQSPPPPELPIE